jgi:hypothetical protein
MLSGLMLPGLILGLGPANRCLGGRNIAPVSRVGQAAQPSRLYLADAGAAIVGLSSSASLIASIWLNGIFSLAHAGFGA